MSGVQRRKSIQCHGIALSQNAPVVFACQSGHDARFETFEAFADSDIWSRSNADFIAQFNDDRDPAYNHTLAHDSFEVTCPECGLSASGVGSDEGPQSHAVGETTDGFQAEVILISNGPTDQTDWWRRRSQHGNTDAYERRECPDCGTQLGDDDYNESPEAPEVGWEYYECPECESRHRPGRIELV